jgi:hypothetical protein
MASTISAGTTTTTALSYSADTSGVLQLQTNGGTTALTLDTSQNVGVGVTPSAWGSTSRALQFQSGVSIFSNTSGLGGVGNNVYSNPGTGDYYIANGYATRYYQYNGTHVWSTSASGTAGNAITFTQAMTLDNSGNLLVGATGSAGSYKVQVYSSNLAATTNGMLLTNGANSTGGYFHAFQNYVGTIIGAISQVTSTTVSYGTASDYRLKENIAPMTGALATVAQLKPCTYTWKLDDSAGQGFIAHELAEVCPEAVVGEKDAVDSDGNPKYQSIDTSFLVAILTAAIQELAAQVTTLQTQVTALKG